MKDSRALVITGMHRSGTSAVASVVKRAGVDIGSRLIEGDAGNPHGYFEDEDFVRFHNQQLARSGQRVLAQVGAELEPFRRRDVRQAEKLIRRRRESGLWGWKDPRASLYLDFWARRLPKARFLLVFRDALEVVLSLLRRGSQHELEVMAEPLAGLRSWRLYNQSIVDFCRRHAQRSFVVDIHDVFADVDGFVEAAAAKLDLPLQSESMADLLHREELHHRPASADVEAILRRIDPHVMELSERLAAAADWSAAGDRPAACDQAMAETLRLLRRLYDGTADPGPVSGPMFSLLLAYLDPGSMGGVSPGAQVVESLENITRWRRHAHNLEAELDRRENLIAELARHAAHLDSRTGELLAHTRGLESALVAAEDHLRAFQSHAENLERRSEQDRLQIDALARHGENLAKLAAERAGQIDDLLAHAGNLETQRAAAREYCRELEQHAGNLETQWAAAREYSRELEQHAGNLETQWAAAREYSRELEGHAGELERLLERQRQQLRELEQHAGNLESLRRRDEERLTARVDELEQHAGNLERELARRQVRLADLEAEHVRLERQLAALEGLRRDLERQVGKRDRGLQDLEARRAQLDARLARQQLTVTELEGEARRLGGELEETLDALHRLSAPWWSRLLRGRQTPCPRLHRAGRMDDSGG